MNRNMNKSNSNYQNKQWQRKPYNNRPFQRKTIDVDTEERFLYPSSAIKVLYDLITPNTEYETYQCAFNKLQALMKATFDPRAQQSKYMRPNLEDLENLNQFGQGENETPITLYPNKFNAKEWATLYIQSIPNLKLPKYDSDWADLFIWVFRNILTAINGIERTENIEETRTLDAYTKTMKRTHNEYQTAVNDFNKYRDDILDMLTGLVASKTKSGPSPINPLHDPSFTEHDDKSVYAAYAPRLAWTLITMRANHINFGVELNNMTILINPSEPHEFKEYTEALHTLRCTSDIRSKYGEALSNCLTTLIERCFMYHHCNTDDDITSVTKDMIDIIISYLDINLLYSCPNFKNNSFVGKLRALSRYSAEERLGCEITMLRNIYPECDSEAAPEELRKANTIKRTAIEARFKTYPPEALNKHLLRNILSDEVEMRKLFAYFTLSLTLCDIGAFRAAITAGFNTRLSKTKIGQIGCSLALNIFTPEECLNDDTFLDQSDRIDALIFALNNAPKNIACDVLQNNKDFIERTKGSFTSMQEWGMFDCCRKHKIPNPLEASNDSPQNETPKSVPKQTTPQAPPQQARQQPTTQQAPRQTWKCSNCSRIIRKLSPYALTLPTEALLCTHCRPQRANRRHF
jgi:hypothetical protein